MDAKTSLFFLLEKDERATLRRKDSDYAELAARAEQVSPNALLRPVWQDYLLPTVAYVGGPGELAYLAQSQVAYELLLGRMPVAMSRSGFTILDARSQKVAGPLSHDHRAGHDPRRRAQGTHRSVAGSRIREQFSRNGGH